MEKGSFLGGWANGEWIVINPKYAVVCYPYPYNHGQNKRLNTV